MKMEITTKIKLSAEELATLREASNIANDLAAMLVRDENTDENYEMDKHVLEEMDDLQARICVILDLINYRNE